MSACRTCHAAGHLWTAPDEWWPCPACGGAGARVMFGPPEIVIGARRRRGNADLVTRGATAREGPPDVSLANGTPP